LPDTGLAGRWMNLMPDHVLVHREPLEQLLNKSWAMFQLLAEESGYDTCDLLPDSELVILAVQASILIPGLMAPGHYPPAPPAYRFRGGTPLAAVYRAPGDNRLRCEADAKVVFCNEAQAIAATRRTAQRMYYYQGPCGHWHLTRRIQDGQ